MLSGARGRQEIGNYRAADAIVCRLARVFRYGQDVHAADIRYTDLRYRVGDLGVGDDRETDGRYLVHVGRMFRDKKHRGNVPRADVSRVKTRTSLTTGVFSRLTKFNVTRLLYLKKTSRFGNNIWL